VGTLAKYVSEFDADTNAVRAGLFYVAGPTTKAAVLGLKLMDYDCLKVDDPDCEDHGGCDCSVPGDCATHDLGGTTADCTKIVPCLLICTEADCQLHQTGLKNQPCDLWDYVQEAHAMKRGDVEPATDDDMDIIVPGSIVTCDWGYTTPGGYTAPVGLKVINYSEVDVEVSLVLPASGKLSEVLQLDNKLGVALKFATDPMGPWVNSIDALDPLEVIESRSKITCMT